MVLWGGVGGMVQDTAFTMWAWGTVVMSCNRWVCGGDSAGGGQAPLEDGVACVCVCVCVLPLLDCVLPPGLQMPPHARPISAWAPHPSKVVEDAE